MKKQILSAIAAAAVLAAVVPAASAQNIAIVNGKPVPTARVEALAQRWHVPAARFHLKCRPS